MKRTETERVTGSPMALRFSALATALAVAIVAGCDGTVANSGGVGGGGNAASAKQLFEQGEKYMLNSEPQKAIAAYSRAIEADPTLEKAYISRAMLYNETGDSKKAFADYTKAIDLGSRNSYAYEERAKIYRAHGKAGKAEQDEECALAIRNKRWDDLQNLKKKK